MFDQDPYALQRQQQRGQQFQQMAVQNPGTGIAGALMALLGGFGGGRMERKASEGLQDLERQQREQAAAQRAAIAEALQGGDPRQAAAMMLQTPEFAKTGIELLTRETDNRVPDALWGKFSPESIAEYTRTKDPSVLRPGSSAPSKGLPTGYRWNEETGQAERIPGIDDYFDRQGRRASGAGSSPTVIINPTTGQASLPPTKPTINAVQDDLIGLQRQLASMDEVANSFAEEALTFQGQARGALAAVGEKLGLPIGEGNKEFLARQRVFQQNVEQLFNQYRVAVTGAAASEKELQFIRSTFLNTDLSPTQFRAAYQQLRSQMERDLNQFQTILQTGIPVEQVRAGFAQLPFGQSLDPATLPSSDAARTQQQLQGELNDVRGQAPNSSGPDIGLQAPRGSSNAVAPPAGLRRIRDDSEYATLPPGPFIDPEGNVRTKL